MGELERGAGQSLEIHYLKQRAQHCAEPVKIIEASHCARRIGLARASDPAPRRPK